jgi:hypothetical protein
MSVDCLERKATFRHRDKCHRPVWLRGVAPKPGVNSTIGDIQVGVVSESDDNLRHPDIAYPAAELSIPAIGDALGASSVRYHVAESPLSCGDILAALWDEPHASLGYLPRG